MDKEHLADYFDLEPQQSETPTSTQQVYASGTQPTPVHASGTQPLPPPGYAESATQPPPAYAPSGTQPVAPPVQVVINNSTQSQPYNYSTVPVFCECPHCHAMITTRVKLQSGLLVWLVALCIFLVTLMFLVCFLVGVPFFIDALKDAYHYCPNCNMFLGAKKQIG